MAEDWHSTAIFAAMEKNVLPKIGIVGGGQLGRMFIQAASNYDLEIHILDPDPKAPCAEMATSFTCADRNDHDAVASFGKGLDFVTIEIENVSTSALKELEKSGVKVVPQPEVIELIRDKGTQKQFFREKGLPTAPFYLVENKAGVEKYAGEFPFMQKMRVGGYDGKGVQPLKTADDLEKAFDAPSVLEKWVDYEKEIAVMVARNEKGEVKSFPVTELEFNPEANLVEFLICPAQVSAETEEKAQQLARDVIEALDMYGLLAVEMFLTHDGEVLINEIAPRPHNSGHHTIEGCAVSQFEQHLRSVVNWPLGDTRATRPAVMVNLLGEKGHAGPVRYEGLEEVLAMPEVYVHLYGKKETKPFRKMGHVTITADSLAEAQRKAVLVKELLKVMAVS